MQQLNYVLICILIVVVNNDRFCFTNGVVRGTMRFIELKNTWMKTAILEGLLYSNKYFSSRLCFFPRTMKNRIVKHFMFTSYYLQFFVDRIISAFSPSSVLI